MSTTKIDLQGHDIRSLSWVGDDLVDVAGGMKKISPESGTISLGSVNYAYSFDSVISTPDGRYAALFERFGTKGLLLKNNQIVREINRSFYHADVYEYPLTFLDSGSDNLRIIHCPKDYNVLQIEDFETGEVITWNDTEPTDFFHSRLLMSPDQRWLLSAGWIWHPIDSIEIFDLSAVPPQRFTPFWSGNMGDIGLWEVNNAAFLSNSSLLLSGTGDQEKEDASEEISLVVFDLDTKEIRSKVTLDNPTGPFFALDENRALAFYEHPRLLDITSGSVIGSWPDVSTDKRNSSISFLDSRVHIAVDLPNRRFAVANDKTIDVIVLDAA